jgi:hypothetical protein
MAATQSNSKTEIVWTPNKHEGKDLKNSSLWNGCYEETEMTEELKQSKKVWYIYHIKFDGLKPIMITKTEEYK